MPCTSFYADANRAAQWRAYVQRDRLPGAPADFAAVGEAISTFLKLVVTVVGTSELFPSMWEVGGPWKERA
jgi:hypothetical protein